MLLGEGLSMQKPGPTCKFRHRLCPESKAVTSRPGHTWTQVSPDASSEAWLLQGPKPHTVEQIDLLFDLIDGLRIGGTETLKGKAHNNSGFLTPLALSLPGHYSGPETS